MLLIGGNTLYAVPLRGFRRNDEVSALKPSGRMAALTSAMRLHLDRAPGNTEHSYDLYPRISGYRKRIGPLFSKRLGIALPRRESDPAIEQLQRPRAHMKARRRDHSHTPLAKIRSCVSAGRLGLRKPPPARGIWMEYHGSSGASSRPYLDGIGPSNKLGRIMPRMGMAGGSRVLEA